jgi:hypothetical protein
MTSETHTATDSTYWAERNALVDAVHARTPGMVLPQARLYVAHAARTPEEQVVWDRYGEALDALRAFDDAHHGTPIL